MAGLYSPPVNAPKPPPNALVPQDGFDAFMQQEVEREKQQAALNAKAVTVANAGANPVAAASAAQIGRVIGLPQAAVEADPERFQLQAIAQKNSDVLDKSPVLAQWVAANPDSARIARDEYESLSAVEKTWDGLKGAGYASLQGLAKPWNSLMFTLNLAGSLAPRLADAVRGDEAASSWYFRNFVDPVVADAEALALNKDAGFAEKAAYTVGNVVGTISQIMTTGPGSIEAQVVGGGMKAVAEGAKQAAAQMAFPALNAGVETGHQVLAATGDQGLAARAAVGSYLLATAQGVVPLSAPGGLVGRLTTGFVSGAVTGEASREAMNLLLPPEMQQQFNGQDLILQGLTGALMGGVLGPRPDPNLQAAIRKTYRDALSAEHTERTVDALSELSETVGESSLRKSAPDRFREFVESVTDQSEVKEVLIDAKTLSGALAQSKVELPPEMVKGLGEAMATGGDASITVADYLTHIAGTDLEAAVLPHLRVEADGPTYSEAKAFYAKDSDQMQKRAQEIAQQKAADDEASASAKVVHDEVLGQLDKAGRFPADVNKVYAAMTRDIFATMAARLGMKAEDLFKKHPLKIAAEQTEGLKQARPEDLIDMRKRSSVMSSLLECLAK